MHGFARISRNCQRYFAIGRIPRQERLKRTALTPRLGLAEMLTHINKQGVILVVERGVGGQVGVRKGLQLVIGGVVEQSDRKAGRLDRFDLACVIVNRARQSGVGNLQHPLVVIP